VWFRRDGEVWPTELPPPLATISHLSELRRLVEHASEPAR
jgi:hypothetical protein